jgi:hypothetical protein
MLDQNSSFCYSLVMKFILLALAINPPTYVGEFDTLKSCENAIVAKITTPIAVPNLTQTQQQKNVTKKVTDFYLQTQQEYRCVAK